VVELERTERFAVW